MKNNSEKSKKVTVLEIAAAAGVSPATVSRVVNQGGLVKEETYKRVIDVMKELGCPIPEDTDKKQMVYIGGLIIINIPTLTNPFYSSVVKGIRTSISRHNYSLLIYEGVITSETIDQLLKTIRQNKIVGLITVTNLETSLLKKLSSATCVIQCSDYNEELDLPYVSIDNTAAAKHAVTHLLAQGKKRIGFINGPQKYNCLKCRLDGYIAALTEANIPLNYNYILQLPDMDSDLAVSVTLQLLSQPVTPDAFFAVSDIYGSAILRACYLAGKRVPEDVAVVGFDNLEISKITIPSLTSVNQPKMQLGFMAGEMMIEKLSVPVSPNKKILLYAELIVRESSSL